MLTHCSVASLFQATTPCSVQAHWARTYFSGLCLQVLRSVATCVGGIQSRLPDASAGEA